MERLLPHPLPAIFSTLPNNVCSQHGRKCEHCRCWIHNNHSETLLHNPERVGNIFGSGIETAKQTIQVTTQHRIRSAIHPLTCHYCTNLLSLRYRCLDVLMHSDTMYFKVKSLNQNKCAQIFAMDDLAITYPSHWGHPSDFGRRCQNPERALD